MPDSAFTINSINPWRMLLFGSIGALIPQIISIIIIDLYSDSLYSGNSPIFIWVLLLSLILSVLGGYWGFKLSALKKLIRISDQGLYEDIIPRLIFLSRTNNIYKWSEIMNYSLTEDSQGKVLEIVLTNHKKITIGTADILNDSIDFDAFYQEFCSRATRFNEEIAPLQNSSESIQQVPGFYKSELAKSIAYAVLILMASVIVLIFILDKVYSFGDWCRMVFFLSLGAWYVWRVMFGEN